MLGTLELARTPSHRQQAELAHQQEPHRTGVGVVDIIAGIVEAVGKIASSVPAIEAASGLKSAKDYANTQAETAQALANAQVEVAQAQSQGTGLALAAGGGALALLAVGYALSRIFRRGRA